VCACVRVCACVCAHVACGNCVYIIDWNSAVCQLFVVLEGAASFVLLVRATFVRGEREREREREEQQTAETARQKAVFEVLVESAAGHDGEGLVACEGVVY